MYNDYEIVTPPDLSKQMFVNKNIYNLQQSIIQGSFHENSSNEEFHNPQSGEILNPPYGLNFSESVSPKTKYEAEYYGKATFAMPFWGIPNLPVPKTDIKPIMYSQLKRYPDNPLLSNCTENIPYKFKASPTFYYHQDKGYEQSDCCVEESLQGLPPDYLHLQNKYNRPEAYRPYGSGLKHSYGLI
jgi:hypothetical protein